MTGLETVEYPAAQGNQVSVFDMLDHAAHGEHFQNAIDLERRLTEVPQNISHKLIPIEEGVYFFEEGGRRPGSISLRRGCPHHRNGFKPGICQSVSGSSQFQCS